MTYQSDFEGLEGWDYAVIVACLGGFLILGLLVRLRCCPRKKMFTFMNITQDVGML